MGKQARKLVRTRKKPAKSSVDGIEKSSIEKIANEFINAELKPRHIQPPPQEPQFNYLTDITTLWHGSSLYFVSTYACPGENAIAPSFQIRFARLERVGTDRFNLSFMRHTEKWMGLYSSITLTECLQAIKDDPWFAP